MRRLFELLRKYYLLILGGVKYFVFCAACIAVLLLGILAFADGNIITIMIYTVFVLAPCLGYVIKYE